MCDVSGVECGGDCSCDCAGTGDSCFQCMGAGDAGGGECSGCFPSGCFGVDASGTAAGGAVPGVDPTAFAAAPDLVPAPLGTADPTATAAAATSVTAIDVDVCDVPAPALAPACCCGDGDGSCFCDDIAKCCVCPLFVPAPVSAPEAIPSAEEARRRRLRYTVGLICLILGIAAVNLLLLLGLRFSSM